MSEKRRDNKNRVLRNGESQQKDGIIKTVFYAMERVNVKTEDICISM